MNIKCSKSDSEDFYTASKKLCSFELHLKESQYAQKNIKHIGSQL